MKITGIIKFNRGKIEYLDNFLEQLKAVKGNPKYNEREAEIVIDFKVRPAAHYRWKYYYGYVIPVVANSSFSGNTERADYEMKHMFLYTKINTLDDIPGEHYPGVCIEHDVETYEGEVVRRPAGYVRGKRTLTDDEAREYILKVEAFIFDFLGQSIDGAGQPYRAKGEI